MKLRIKGNSIRLRLGQSEVKRLQSSGAIEECTVFGPSAEQRFVYAICASSEQRGVSADFMGRRLTICAPLSGILRLASTDQVGIHAVQQTGDGNELKILIEKDFECTDAPADDSQKDAFPRHPSDSARAAGK